MIITFHSFINRSIDKACCILARFGGMGENPELRPIIPPQCEFTPVGIVSFTMPGSNDVAHKVADILGENGRVCLIKNHGMFCHWKSRSHRTGFIKREKSMKKIYQIIASCYLMTLFYRKIVNNLWAKDNDCLKKTYGNMTEWTSFVVNVLFV